MPKLEDAQVVADEHTDGRGEAVESVFIGIAGALQKLVICIIGQEEREDFGGAFGIGEGTELFDERKIDLRN